MKNIEKETAEFILYFMINSFKSTIEILDNKYSIDSKKLLMEILEKDRSRENG